MDNNYSKREIDFLIESINQHINDTIVGPLGRIEAQTLKTNGRVTKLEGWKSGVTAAIAILAITVPTCIGWFFYKLTGLSDSFIAHASQDKESFQKLNNK